jgi:hypothetical protein
MPESGIFRVPPLQGWQRANVIAAANCLREQLGRTPDDPKLRTAYEGLLDLLDPSRTLARRQREQADAARQAATARRVERRSQERRVRERRTAPGPLATGVERRRADRRSGRDRRGRG